MFDSQKVAIMRFGPRGEPRGGEILAAPELLAQHLVWWKLSVKHAEPRPPWDYMPSRA